MQGNAPLSPITGVPGWETPAEQDYLYTSAQSLPDKAIIVEIGGEFGMSASLFSKGAPGSRIYSIDIRYPGPIADAHAANLIEAGLGSNVTRIGADSQSLDTPIDFLGRFKTPTPIDLLFIDGDHSFSGALTDLSAWAPLVKPGGLMILHDTAAQTNLMPHPLHFDVSRALATWYANNGANWAAVTTVDTITAFQRQA